MSSYIQEQFYTAPMYPEAEMVEYISLPMNEFLDVFSKIILLIAFDPSFRVEENARERASRTLAYQLIEIMKSVAKPCSTDYLMYFLSLRFLSLVDTKSQSDKKTSWSLMEPGTKER